MGLPVCAVWESGSNGRRRVFGVGLDRFDHQIKLVSAVDFAKDAVGLIGQDALGFGEVVEAVDAVGVAVFHEEHRALGAFGAGEQDEMIGAEVKHGLERPGEAETRRERARDQVSRPLRSADVELARRTPPGLGVIITARRLS